MDKKDVFLSSKLSVRQLIAGARQTGSLTNPSYGPARGLEGMRAHKKFVNILSADLENISLNSEYSLKTEYRFKAPGLEYLLEISGRSDLWYLAERGLCLIEIKSYRGDLSEDKVFENPLHWAQAEVYSYILLEEMKEDNDFEKIIVSLAYISVDSSDYKIIEKEMDYESLKSSFEDICSRWLKNTISLIDYRRLRDLTNIEPGFPYENLREGQHFFMRQAMAAIRDTAVLFAQAATGSGKTMNTLYPAVKAQAAGLGSTIFYLTNMSSTKEIAEQAVNDLKAAGFMLRSITLTAKEKICLAPDLFCEQKLCPFAQDYYLRLPDALIELAGKNKADLDTITGIAKKHTLCPFELQLDFSEWCDIVIGDYNYFFDPRVSLQRFFHADNKAKHILLIDEAHNLPGRSRQMYSAFLELAELKKSLVELSAPEIMSFAPVIQLINRLKTVVESLEKLLPQLATGDEYKDNELLGTAVDSRDLLLAADFLGTRKKLESFLANIGSLIYFLAQFMEHFTEFEHIKELKELWFKLHFYQRVAECFYDKNYITMIRRLKDDNLMIGQLCLDAGTNLTSRYFQRYPVIFFSATLNPADYYKRLLYDKNTEDPADDLYLPSPFAPENRLVLAMSNYSVRYKDRANTIFPILEFIFKAVQLQPGNYLVFCPSFSYLHALRNILQKTKAPDNWQIMLQNPKMNELDKDAWLERFRSPKQKPLLAFACMGSIFSEGIDLTGRQLVGVFVIGTGLPRPSPERELMCQYYELEFGSGFHFAYTFPGFNRVMQAAGRLIRSETDRGVIVLIDDRYSREDYLQLMPKDWYTVYVQDDEEALLTIEDFWAEN